MRCPPPLFEELTEDRMRNVTKTLTALAVAGGTLLGANEALAASSVHGVAMVHGTGDYAGTQSCSGTGTGFKCVVQNAIDNYWSATAIDTYRNGRPFAVTGHHGGTMTPWANASPYKNSGSETTTGSAYEAATQLNRFLAGPDGVYGTADDITDLVIITHSGGSNVARYILQHPTINSNFQHVKDRTRKVITVAAPGKGTYLADRVFANDSSLLTLAGSALASMMGFKDDGTKFIQTTEMASYNTDAAKLVNVSASQNGVPFYATGGTSTTKCVGVTLFGKCLGVTVGSLGPSYCDSTAMSLGLSALHTAFLNSNDSATARNSCSDGFISCASSQYIGTTFSFGINQDHNQSRKNCNGLPSNIATQVSNAMTGFENTATPSQDVAVEQWDSCGFSTYGTLTSSTGSTVGYGGGCAHGDLGDGYCDATCLSVYGHDAAPTWDATGKKVIAWGATDDCSGTLATGTNPAGFSSSNNVWSDGQTYSADQSSWYYTQYTGKTRSGSSTVYFTDPLYGTTSAVGYCPQSWIGDGTCDECVLALYGNDGNDCAPGKTAQCGGLLSKYDPYTTTSNPFYNEGDPTTSGSTWYFWYTTSWAAPGNGTCDVGECTRNKWSPCTVDTDCSTGTCTSGYCADSASTCNVTADCLTGACVNGACTTGGTDCTFTSAGGVTSSLCR
jgi:hypothetical protein